jgi:uncharacterized protein YndB with AHSA1/START domain
MRKVEVTQTIATTPGRIIQAFVDQNLLNGWWGVQRSLIELKSGGLYILGWDISDKGFGYLSTGTIKTYEPDGILEVDNYLYCNPQRPFFGPMTLTVKVRPQGNKTSEIYLCQDGYREGADWDWYHNVVVDAWPVVVNSLKDYLEMKFRKE